MKLPLLFSGFFATLLNLSISGQALQANMDVINFGELFYGNKDSVEVTLSNLSDNDVTVTNYRFFDFFASEPFYTNSQQLLVPANGSNSFYVVFEPVHNMQHNSELVIYDNANLGSIAIDLRGTGKYANSYYDGTEDLLDVELKDELQNIISAGYQSHSYNEARDEMFMIVDNQQVNGQGAAVNTLTRAYIGTDAVGYTSRSHAQTSYNLNTEHTWPQGTFDQNIPMRSDLHHLFVTDVNANSIRGNYQFGEVVENINWSEGGSMRGNDIYGATVFEPRDAHKGKAARAILYFVIRYQNYGNYLASNQENVLVQWNKQFLPTDVEVTRNDHIQDFQNNRNPFTDYPQFADRIHAFRIDANRPEMAEIELSDQEIAFGVLQDAQTFNLVITNYGNATADINGIQIADGASQGFSLPDGFSSSAQIAAGESLQIPVTAGEIPGNYAETLTFNTNIAGMESVEIPLQVGFPVSVEEFAAVDFSVYPQPSWDYINVVFPPSVEIENLSYTFIDANGKEVESGKLNCSASPCIINPVQVSNGLYMLLLKDNNGVIGAEKVIRSGRLR